MFNYFISKTLLLNITCQILLYKYGTAQFPFGLGRLNFYQIAWCLIYHLSHSLNSPSLACMDTINPTSSTIQSTLFIPLSPKCPWRKVNQKNVKLTKCTQTQQKPFILPWNCSNKRCNNQTWIACHALFLLRTRLGQAREDNAIFRI